MKLAKPSQRDLDAGGDLMCLLNDLSGGYYPAWPGVARGENDPDRFDEDDRVHLAHLYGVLDTIINKAPGGWNRVIGTAYVVMDPANGIVDPDADVLELHPDLKRGQELLAATTTPDNSTSAPTEAEQCAAMLRDCANRHPRIGGTGYDVPGLMRDAALHIANLLAASVPAVQAQAAHIGRDGRSDTDAFKRFHRSLCARFGYSHDPIDWRRDLVSLEEHIASRLAAPAVQVGAGERETEAFIQAAIDRAPEPLRRLGEWLAQRLDEDQWKTAERMLLGASAEQGAYGPLLAEALAFVETNTFGGPDAAALADRLRGAARGAAPAPASVAEVCPICDIAGCRHIRERAAAPASPAPGDAPVPTAGDSEVAVRSALYEAIEWGLARDRDTETELSIEDAADRIATAAIAAPATTQQPLQVGATALAVRAPSDAEIDALDTMGLHCMAPRHRESVREFARTVLATWAAPPAAQQEPTDDALQLGEEVARLQNSLAFWLPDVPPVEHPLHERIANDSFLLRGYDGNCDEPSAYEQGLAILRENQQKPVAWMVWADNGNCRLWTTTREQIERHNPELAAQACPLYAAPTTRSEQGEDADRYRHLRACNSGSLVIVKIMGTGDDEQQVLTEADADAEVDAERARFATQATKGTGEQP